MTFDGGILSIKGGFFIEKENAADKSFLKDA